MSGADVVFASFYVGFAIASVSEFDRLRWPYLLTMVTMTAILVGSTKVSLARFHATEGAAAGGIASVALYDILEDLLTALGITPIYVRGERLLERRTAVDQSLLSAFALCGLALCLYGTKAVEHSIPLLVGGMSMMIGVPAMFLSSNMRTERTGVYSFILLAPVVHFALGDMHWLDYAILFVAHCATIAFVAWLNVRQHLEYAPAETPMRDELLAATRKGALIRWFGVFGLPQLVFFVGARLLSRCFVSFDTYATGVARTDATDEIFAVAGVVCCATAASFGLPVLAFRLKRAALKG